MNKKELIEQIECLKNIFGNECEYVKIDFVIELASELDEPEKVTIPQVIAEYIEQKKDDDYHLLGAMIEIRSHKNKEIDEWFEFKEDDNMETFARAWIDGYEVEKEKRYTVVIKKTKQPLYYNASENKLFFSMAKIASHFTRQQLEKLNFGWVFDCPGIEIEEVTE